MSREDIQKLLGGYATGTLTPEEQEALFAAALDDQDLFDALAREQSLRDLLRDPAAKAHLLTALDERPKSGWASWWRPTALGLSMAAVTVLAVVVIRQSIPAPEPPRIAMVEPKSEAPQAAAPAAVPAGAPAAGAELARAKDNGATAPRNEKRVAAKSNADQFAAVPPPPAGQPTAAAPPPAQRSLASTPKSETEAVVLSAESALARAGARQSFLSQAAGLGGYAGAGQQGQLREQSPAPPRQNDQLADAKMPAQAPQPGIRYTIVGSQIRLETNDDGYLSATAHGNAGVWRVVHEGPAQRMQPYLTLALRPDEKEIFVSFSRQVEVIKSGPRIPQPGSEPDTNLVEKEGETTYVVKPSTGADSRQLSFTIRLP